MSFKRDLKLCLKILLVKEKYASIKQLWRMCWVSDHSCEEAVFRNSGDLCRKQPNVQLILRVHLDHTIR